MPTFMAKISPSLDVVVTFIKVLERRQPLFDEADRKNFEDLQALLAGVMHCLPLFYRVTRRRLILQATR